MVKEMPEKGNVQLWSGKKEKGMSKFNFKNLNLRIKLNEPVCLREVHTHFLNLIGGKL